MRGRREAKKGHLDAGVRVEGAGIERGGHLVVVARSHHLRGRGRVSAGEGVGECVGEAGATGGRGGESWAGAGRKGRKGEDIGRGAEGRKAARHHAVAALGERGWEGAGDVAEASGLGPGLHL